MPEKTSRLRTIFAARSASWRICRSSALLAGVASDDRSSSSRWPSTPCSGLFISCAMPATNWPSDGELLRLREALAQRLALGLEPRLPVMSRADEHASEWRAVAARSAA